MALIDPFRGQTSGEINEDNNLPLGAVRPAINGNLPRAGFSPEIELLKKSGIVKTTDGIEGHFLDIMSEVGLDARSILSRLAVIMDSGESDGAKLGAIKLATMLHMHPAVVVARNKEERSTPSITFVVQSPQVNMQNVLAPNQNFDQKQESW